MTAFSKRTACITTALHLLGIIAATGTETPSPVTVTKFQANNGEMIVRSRTVNLTIDATSTAGSIKMMLLGDSVRGQFGAAQAFKKTITYSFPENATGRQVIAGVFQDSKGNNSEQTYITLDIIPDQPVQPALTAGTISGMSLRRGNTSHTRLTDAVNDTGNPIVQLSTNLDDILVQLSPAKAPHTVANFLQYVDSNEYDYSFFHRSVPGFIIQGGGSFIDTENQNTITPVPNHGTVINEPNDSNLRGTIAMAKLGGDPDSASNQWFFNLADNSENLDNQNGGFTVFGNVLAPSMSVVDAIAALPVSNQSETLGFDELPVTRTLTESDTLQLSDLVLIGKASRYRFSVVKQAVGVKATIDNNYLYLEPSGKPLAAQSSITLRAVAPDGRYLDFSIPLDIATNHPMLAKGVGTMAVKAKEDTPVDIPIAVTNPDNSPLTWDFSELPTKGECVLLPESKQGVRTVRYTPNSNASGSDSFTLHVIDNDANPQKSGQDQVKVNLTIAPVNDLPTISAPATHTMTGGSASSFDIEVADVETPADNLIVTCTASGSVLPKGSVVLEGSGSTRTVRLSPTATTKAVSVPCTIKVTDGDKKSTIAKVMLTVNP